MQRFGQRRVWLIAGLLAAALPSLWMWGFTVDDALIAVRYARHLAAGAGWRFNVGGPSTDGVTPLPWPVLLAALAAGGAGALEVLARAKVLGLLAWTAAGGALGDAIGREGDAPAWARGGVLAVLALSVPVAAYAVSGMETAIATSLATFAVLQSRRPWAVAVLAGLAASLRPEMAPWACAAATGLALAAGRRAARAAAVGLAALVPFLVCVAVRVAVWGRPGPLALMAKPGVASLGLVYAGAACVVTLVPLLVVAPLALRRSPVALAIAAAALVHLAAVAAVGGDWMPLSRLVVPVVPSLAYAAALLAKDARRVAVAVRTGVTLAVGVVLVARGGTKARDVGADRAALVAEARPVLEGVGRVASADIGWVGAATDAEIVDLAGLTDPAIAALPGGHMAKRVDAMFLLSRDPEVLLFYLPLGLPGGELGAWSSATFAHAVEYRLGSEEVVARHFEATAWLPLGAAGSGYVLLKKRE